MKWIDTQKDLDAGLAGISSQEVIAVDTEADSLHSYFDKTCLIQISASSEDLIIDPLRKLDLAAFGRLLADTRVRKVFHGADYDLRILNRDFGFTIQNVFDTMVSAQLLGYEAVGLAALLKRHFNADLDKSHQRANWAMRPLPKEMLEYAATDTRHLIELSVKLEAELLELGRWEWAVEEFQRLEALRFKESEATDAFRKIKGSNRLERRSLAVLERLHAWRDGLARQYDRPPFKIIGNEQLIGVSQELPKTREELGRIKGLSGFHLAKYADPLLLAVRQALELTESDLPEKIEGKSWKRDREIEHRVDRLKKVRDSLAKTLKVDPSIVAPKHVLSAIATANPESVVEMAEIAGMREWQRKLVGEELLEALRRN